MRLWYWPKEGEVTGRSIRRRPERQIRCEIEHVFCSRSFFTNSLPVVIYCMHMVLCMCFEV